MPYKAWLEARIGERGRENGSFPGEESSPALGGALRTERFSK